MGERASGVPTRKLPTLVVKVMARFNPEMRALAPLLGKPRSATSAKAERVLGWKPRSWQDAVVATAESLFALDLVRPRSRA